MDWHSFVFSNVFVFKFILCDICIATPGLFIWGIFSPFTFNLLMPLNLKCVFWGQPSWVVVFCLNPFCQSLPFSWSILSTKSKCLSPWVYLIVSLSLDSGPTLLEKYKSCFILLWTLHSRSILSLCPITDDVNFDYWFRACLIDFFTVKGNFSSICH